MLGLCLSFVTWSWQWMRLFKEVVEALWPTAFAHSTETLKKVLMNLYNNPESNNIGWLIDDEFSGAVLNGEPVACSKLGKMLQRKMPRGKGYFTFIDKMNRHRAEAFKRKEITTKASNLCQETNLIANEKYTFSCVIFELQS